MHMQEKKIDCFEEDAFVKHMHVNGGMTNGLTQVTVMVWNMLLLRYEQPDKYMVKIMAPPVHFRV